MEKSKPLSKIFNLLIPLRDYLYIFQLTEYNTLAYLRLTPKLIFQRNLQKHGTLRATDYIKSVTVLFILLLTIISTLIYILTKSYLTTAILVLVIIQILSPLIIITASILLKPIYKIKVYRIKNFAKTKISAYKQTGLKTIGITGSHGKTTTKNILFSLINNSYKTQMIPGNINTTIGISNWIKEHLNKNTEILIVEMGAYVTGEIKDSTLIIQPDIAIITAIAKQHMEKFKTFENLINAKYEIFEYSSSETKCLTSKDLKEILPKKREDILYVSEELPDYIESQDILIKKNFPLAYKTAQLLEIREEIIKASTQNINLPERRGNISKYKNYQIIDSSYNISFDTAFENIKRAGEIAQNKNKSLIIISGGIPETGEEEQLINNRFFNIMRESTDNIILLNTYLNRMIIKESTNSILYVGKSIEDSYSYIENTFTPEEVLILVFPELTDLHYL